MKPLAGLLFLFVIVFLNACKTDASLTVVKRDCTTSNPVHDTLVLLVMGQSNAANAGETKYEAHCKNTFNYFAETLYPLTDPLKGANGEAGSVWSRLGDKIVEHNFARTVIIVPCAFGGTRIEQWIPGGDLNHLIGETVQHLNNSGLKVTHVLWHQGESNHVLVSGGLPAEQNAANYTVNFHLLVNYLRNMGIEAPIYPAMATRCAGAPDFVLQEAQRNLADDSLKIFNGPNTDSLDNAYRYDNCHFSKTGLNVHAQLWLEAIMR